PALLTS
ncbi:hypothetical protein STRIP9103_08337, partial [Streptomyces ipomoeae 91-03]